MDSILLVSFGGPEGPDDVMPFLENVLRGKNVPRERMLEVAEHYQHFGGVSPINEQNRLLIQHLRIELDRRKITLPIYWGNRNWHPQLPDVLRHMRDDGKQHAIAVFTSIFSSYSGCRQYRENIAAAQSEVGEGAPKVEKVRMGFNHPLFIKAVSEQISSALEQVGRTGTKILFTAHSIPLSMAQNCNYEKQLREACRLVTERLAFADWELVYQSRSGPPTQPWLEPDVCDRIEQLPSEGFQGVVIQPIGFVSDHIEVLYDLDTEARAASEKAGLKFARAATVGVHPDFVSMLAELIQERLESWTTRDSIGLLPPSHDVCPADCCLYPRPTRPN